MLTRLFTRDGIKLIEHDSRISLDKLYQLIHDTVKNSYSSYCVFMDNSRQKLLPKGTQRVETVLNNRTVLFVEEDLVEDMKNLSVKSSNVINSVKVPSVSDIDMILEKEEGTIPGKYDTSLCRHNRNGKCGYCKDMQPYDREYLDKLVPSVKHVPFHTYVRKIVSLASNVKYVQLDVPRCYIDTTCKRHAPWPKAICGNCRPDSITLDQQEYRFVDNVMFDHHEIVDRFIESWRKTGAQRVGYLYGYYARMDSIMLGIRAVVCAIFEPKQSGTSSSVEFLDDYNMDFENEFAAKLGLLPIGWIVTHLIPSKDNSKIVECVRNDETYHVSSGECIVAGNFQLKYKNPCKYSKTGFFGSKFVTVIVSGNKQNEIDITAWQVSTKAMALIESDCLVPTVEHPGLAYVKNSTPQKLIPDTFYRCNDEFNNVVMKIARPVPVEVFLVQLSSGFPLNPKPYLFITDFPVTNMEGMSQLRNCTTLGKCVVGRDPDDLWHVLKNFHLLLYIYSLNKSGRKAAIELTYFIQTNNFDGFLDFIASRAWSKFISWIISQVPSDEYTVTKNSDGFGKNSNNSSRKGRKRAKPNNTQNKGSKIRNNENSVNQTNDDDFSWHCIHCTFFNQTIIVDEDDQVACAICNLPKM